MRIQTLVAPIAVLLLPVGHAHSSTFILDTYVSPTLSPLVSFEGLSTNFGGRDVGLFAQTPARQGIGSQHVLMDRPEFFIEPRSSILFVDFGFSDSVQIGSTLATYARVVASSEIANIPGNIGANGAFGEPEARLEVNIRRPAREATRCFDGNNGYCFPTTFPTDTLSSIQNPGNNLNQFLDSSASRSVVYREQEIARDYSEWRSISLGFETLDTVLVPQRDDGTSSVVIAGFGVEFQARYIQTYRPEPLGSVAQQLARAANYREAADLADTVADLTSFANILSGIRPGDEQSLFEARGALFDFIAIETSVDRIIASTPLEADELGDRTRLIELQTAAIESLKDAFDFGLNKTRLGAVTAIAQASQAYFRTLAYVTERIAADPPRDTYRVFEDLAAFDAAALVREADVFKDNPLFSADDVETLANIATASDRLFVALVSYERFQGALIEGEWALADAQFRLAREAYSQGLDLLDVLGIETEGVGILTPMSDLQSIIDWEELRNRIADFFVHGASDPALELIVEDGSFDFLLAGRANGLFEIDFRLDEAFGTSFVDTYGNEAIAPVPVPSSFFAILASFGFLMCLRGIGSRRASGNTSRV